MFFLAAQFLQLAGWGHIDYKDPITGLITNPDPNLIGLLALPSSSPTTALLYGVWRDLKSLLHITGFLSFTPLWHNPGYPEVANLQGFHTWKSKGIFICTVV